MIQAPIWAFLVAVIIVTSLVGAWRLFEDQHNPYDMSPLLGCGVLMLGVIGVLAVLLVHAWGWL